jgi:ATP-dependent protease HslVU (ClpYQ) peptidase subunit
MTCIAWDGKTLAADRQATGSNTRASTTKIAKVSTGSGPVMVGVSGRGVDAQAFFRWARARFDPAAWPEALRDSDSTALVVLPSGETLIFEDSPYPIVFHEQKHAIGSGMHFALAAMHLGKNARAAVQVACDLDIGCGCGIDTLTFTRAELRA